MCEYILGRFCMNKDVSSQTLNELISSNPDLRDYLEKIEQENRLILSRFTHELRNPLTLLKSTIQLIETKHPEAKDFIFWNQLIPDIEETIGLLDELSIYNHCDQLNLETVDYIELVQQAIQSAQAYASSKQVIIKLVNTTFDPLLTSIYCDKVKMKQLLLNLLKNASEAAFESSNITVELSIENGPKTNGHYINLSITNLGIPIPIECLSNIFEPFVTTKQNGTGLGLAVAKKIATLHKGDLSVSQTESAVTFTLLFPIE